MSDINPDDKKATRVRASSWGQLFDCAHKWEGQHLLGMKLPSGPRAALGTAIHAGTAAFDKGRMGGEVITATEAAQIVVDKLQKPEDDVNWSSDDISPNEAEQTGVILTTKYCLEVSPHYEFTAVEMETKPMRIDCGNGVFIDLTGTLDRSRLSKDGLGTRITDLKSGGTAVQKGVANTKGHGAQVGTYEMLYTHSTGEEITGPAEIIGLKTNGKPEIGTGQIHNGRRLMLGTETQPGLIHFAAEMFRTGLFPPNPQSMLCSPKYCARWGTCIYHD